MVCTWRRHEDGGLSPIRLGAGGVEILGRARVGLRTTGAVAPGRYRVGCGEFAVELDHPGGPLDATLAFPAATTVARATITRVGPSDGLARSDGR